MRDGLKIIQLTGNYYGRAVTKIAYVRRRGGDEYDILPGARVVVVKNGKKGRGLESLATKGLGKEYEFMFEASEGVEEISRILVRRALVADEAAWREYIKRPDGWKVEEE